MAAEPKKFKDFQAFCEFYEKKINAEACINVDAKNVKQAALNIIELLKKGNIASPQFFQGSYDTIRAGMGFQTKDSASHTAKTAEHYRLALIARDMFKDILDKNIEHLGQVVSVAINGHRRFIEKRYKELDALINHYEMNPKLKNEVEDRLIGNVDLLFTLDVDENGRPKNRERGAPFSDCYLFKKDVTTETLQKFVDAVKNEVENVFLIPSDRQALFADGNFSYQNNASVMPRSSVLNQFFVRTGRPYRFNPFAIFEEAVKRFGTADEQISALQKEMHALEEQCQVEAPIAKAKSEYCNAYAVEASGQGLIRNHQAIYHYLKETMNEYNGRMAHNPFSRNKDLHKESMAKLTTIAKEISASYQKVATRPFSFADLHAILQNFERYETELMAMREAYHQAYGNEEKAKKSEEYQFIDTTYKMVQQLNEQVKNNPKLNADAVLKMMSSVSEDPKGMNFGFGKK